MGLDVSCWVLKMHTLASLGDLYLSRRIAQPKKKVWQSHLETSKISCLFSFWLTTAFRSLTDPSFSTCYHDVWHDAYTACFVFWTVEGLVLYHTQGSKKSWWYTFSATGKNLLAWIPSRRSWKVQEKAKAGGLTGKQNSDQAHLVDWNWWFSCKRGPWPCSNCSGWWLRQPCASNLCFMWSIWSTRCKHRAWSVEMATGSLGGPFGTIWDQTTIAGLVSEPIFLLYFNLKLSFTRAKLKGFFSDEDVHPKGQRNSMSPRGTIPRPSC